jgi:hypothetical protein
VWEGFTQGEALDTARVASSTVEGESTSLGPDAAAASFDPEAAAVPAAPAAALTTVRPGRRQSRSATRLVMGRWGSRSRMSAPRTAPCASSIRVRTAAGSQAHSNGIVQLSVLVGVNHESVIRLPKDALNDQIKACTRPLTMQMMLPDSDEDVDVDVVVPAAAPIAAPAPAPMPQQASPFAPPPLAPVAPNTALEPSALPAAWLSIECRSVEAAEAHERSLRRADGGAYVEHWRAAALRAHATAATARESRVASLFSGRGGRGAKAHANVAEGSGAHADRAGRWVCEASHLRPAVALEGACLCGSDGRGSGKGREPIESGARDMHRPQQARSREIGARSREQPTMRRAGSAGCACDSQPAGLSASSSSTLGLSGRGSGGRGSRGPCLAGKRRLSGRHSGSRHSRASEG